MKPVAHFNVDTHIHPFLKGQTYPFSLSVGNLIKIKGKEKIEIISLKSQSSIDEAILCRFPQLKLLITRTVGTDHIDLVACKKRGIEVKNIPDYGARNIAEHALALLMNGARSIVQANGSVHRGLFSYEDFLGTSFKGKVLGVIGTGRIGLELIRLTRGFDMKTVCFDAFKNSDAEKELGFSYVSLPVLLKVADFISIHVPLLDSTRHLMGEREMGMMKKGAVLVNTSRGEIIDEKALLRHIKKCKAVCLDVIENEKRFTLRNPLLKHTNVILTPHIGFYTDDSIETIGKKTEEYITHY